MVEGQPGKAAVGYGPDHYQHMNSVARRYQDGDVVALGELHALLAKWLSMAVWQAAPRGTGLTVIDVDDLKQEAWIVLALLTLRWEPTEGVHFAGYFMRAFPWAIRRVLRSHNASQRSKSVSVVSANHDTLILSLDRRSEIDGQTWPDAIFWKEFLARLQPRERDVLWLHAVEGYSFQEISKLLGVGRSSVYDAYQRAVAQARGELRDEAA